MNAISNTRNLILTLAMAAVPMMAHAAVYELDTAHTEVGFGVRHVGINVVRGNFQTFTGQIEFDAAKPEASKLKIEVNTDSLDTRNGKRDEHVKSADFLDVKKFPKMTFVSKSVKPAGKGAYTVVGDLTLHGVTKPITLAVTDFAGPGLNPLDKKNHIGASATGSIKRQDFGITWNGGGATGLAGEAAIGDEVKLQIDLDAVQK